MIIYGFFFFNIKLLALILVIIIIVLLTLGASANECVWIKKTRFGSVDSGDSAESSDEKSRRPVTGKRKRQTSADDEDDASKTRRCRRSVRQRRSVDSLSAKDRNTRRLESNERERLRMHSLNDAFEVRNVRPGFRVVITGVISFFGNLSKSKYDRFWFVIQDVSTYRECYRYGNVRWRKHL